jgi:hypothetical protein
VIDIKSLMMLIQTIQVEHRSHQQQLVQQAEQQPLLLLQAMTLVHYHQVGKCRKQKMNGHFLLITLIKKQHG